MGQVVDLPRRHRKVQPAFFTSSMVCQPAWEPPARAHGLRPSGDPNFPLRQAYFGKASVRSLEDTSLTQVRKAAQLTDSVWIQVLEWIAVLALLFLAIGLFIYIGRGRP
jgi:hypothetical protein